MIVFPAIDPVAFHIGPLRVHWYGLMYMLGFLMAWYLARWRVRHFNLDWSDEAISDLIFNAALGVILGGRVGYLLFYQTKAWFDQPLLVFKIWQGGMSFHGGLLGVVVALAYVAWKTHRRWLEVLDFTAPLVPLGLAAGRIGNFLNGELWGRITTMPWGMVFPHVDDWPRHPSQIYEFFLEGLVLWIVVWRYARKPRASGQVAAVFLMGYACARIVVECFREPDYAQGYFWGYMTEGQLLSVPMLLIGFLLWWVQQHAHILNTTRSRTSSRHTES